MGDQKNLVIAIVASLVILIGWHYAFEKPRLERLEAERVLASGTPAAAPATDLPAPDAPPADPVDGASLAAPALEPLAAAPRVAINTPHLHGSLSLRGGLIDDVTLAQYHTTIDPLSPEIVVLAPRGGARPYYVQTGWIAAPDISVPGNDTIWTSDRDALTPENPVTLSWDNGQGLRFTRRIAVDDHFMFTVTDSVENYGAGETTLYPFSLAARAGTPKTLGFFILHEGPLGVINDTLEEFKYDDLREDGPYQATSTPGGWVGFTDHYWLVALAPAATTAQQVRVRHAGAGGIDRYQVDTRGEAITLAPGASAEATNRIFTGAKIVDLLDDYSERYGIDRFDLAVDFGWFYFLTKPIFHILVYFASWLGNFGLAILLLTVIIKILFFPLANKSYKAMGAMKRLQPKMMELRETYKDDRQRMNQELIELYRREKVNPASGCLPIFVQIPVFFALYKVLFVTIEMRHAPFYGWIHDLSAPDPTSWLNLFGMAPWGVPELGFLHFFNLGVWPLIMGASMYLQQKINPQPADPVQARIFLLMPIVFTFLLGQFAAGLVIYWAWNNILSIAQQWVIMRREGADPLR